MDPFFAVETDQFDILKGLKKENSSLLQKFNRYGYQLLEWAYLLGKSKAAGILENRTPKMLKIDLGNGIQKITPAEFPHYFDVAYYPHIHFNTTEFLRQKLCEAPWFIAHTPVGHQIRQDGLTFRPELATGYVANTVIRWIDDDIGYGLFAGIDFLPGTYIAEYAGQVRQISRREKDLNSYCFHYPTRWFSWNYTVIDAINEGNETRFINHSDNPNLQPRWLYDRGLMHLTFFAATFIPKGTQLTFNYGKDFWENRPSPRELQEPIGFK